MKFEIRSPKLETKLKLEYGLIINFGSGVISGFQVFLSCFGFRASDFGFPGEIFAG